MATVEETQQQVRARYAAAAVSVRPGRRSDSPDGVGSTTCCVPAAQAFDQDGQVFGAGLYGDVEAGELPNEALLASLGCGDPVAGAVLHEGERVLDLGCGGGIDVLL